MREQGAFVEGAIACGHSVGEYTALACVTGVYELEALLEVVFHRGSKMHDIVPGYLANPGLVGGPKGYLPGPGAVLYGLPSTVRRHRFWPTGAMCLPSSTCSRLPLMTSCRPCCRYCATRPEWAHSPHVAKRVETKEFGHAHRAGFGYAG